MLSIFSGSPVFNAGQVSLIAVIINDLYIIYNISRKITCGSLHITTEEILAINANAADLLALRRHLSVFVYCNVR